MNIQLPMFVEKCFLKFYFSVHVLKTFKIVSKSKNDIKRKYVFRLVI